MINPVTCEMTELNLMTCERTGAGVAWKATELEHMAWKET